MSDLTLYKFRPLANELDLCRAEKILTSGAFWCSNFPKLNDPMEGVFRSPLNGLADIYKEKFKYGICSFSGKEAFSNPAMWGYYAGGFRGIAVEVEVSDGEVKPISYVDNIGTLREKITHEEIEKILTKKLNPWKHEVEYRFLEMMEEQHREIGEITAVYFGDPYGEVDNRDDIIANNPHIVEYHKRRARLIESAKDIPWRFVKVVGCCVVPNERLNPLIHHDS